MEEVKEGKDYSFPGTEEEILAYWDKIKAFEGQLEWTKDKKPYVFYDGPPFATGLPHYGHLLAGTIKVIIFPSCCTVLKRLDCLIMNIHDPAPFGL